MRSVLSLVVAGAVLALAGCGGGGAGADSATTTGDRPHIVVTTSMLGDVVRIDSTTFWDVMDVLSPLAGVSALRYTVP